MCLCLRNAWPKSGYFFVSQVANASYIVARYRAGRGKSVEDRSHSIASGNWLIEISISKFGVIIVSLQCSPDADVPFSAAYGLDEAGPTVECRSATEGDRQRSTTAWSTLNHNVIGKICGEGFWDSPIAADDWDLGTLNIQLRLRN